MHFREKYIRACALKLNFENRNKIFVKFISKLQESALTWLQRLILSTINSQQLSKVRHIWCDSLVEYKNVEFYRNY